MKFQLNESCSVEFAFSLCCACVGCNAVFFLSSDVCAANVAVCAHTVVFVPVKHGAKCVLFSRAGFFFLPN